MPPDRIGTGHTSEGTEMTDIATSELDPDAIGDDYDGETEDEVLADEEE